MDNSLPQLTKAKVIPVIVITLLVFGLFAVLAAAVLVVGSSRVVSQDERLREERLKKLKNKRAMDDYLLTTYGWVNEEAGVARIPIDRAMELTAQDLKAKPLREAGFVDPRKEAKRLEEEKASAQKKKT